MPLVTRYFSFEDVAPEMGWKLLDWCRSNGAEEFTITALTSPTESERMRAFFAELTPYSRPEGARRRLSASIGGTFTPVVEQWQLNEQTVSSLRLAMPAGYTTRTVPDLELWLEDLTVYRDGEFMMGVLSHESGGVLRIAELELRSLRNLGFPDRNEVPWIGF
jgi:hypothetical protein